MILCRYRILMIRWIHFRPLWSYYFENNDAVIYVVDSSDRERFDEAKEELWDLITDDRLRDSSLLVLANKQVYLISWSKFFPKRINFYNLLARYPLQYFLLQLGYATGSFGVWDNWCFGFEENDPKAMVCTSNMCNIRRRNSWRFRMACKKSQRKEKELKIVE